MPEISVIVPVYNTAPRLDVCLASLAAQRLPDFEAILVNDGSTDESGAILASWAEKDPRFQVLTRENGGLSAARNTGVAAASGEYLAFLDSDDTLAPDFLSKLYEKALSEDLDLVLCAFAYVYPDGRRVEAPVRHHLSEDPAREYLLSEPMAPVRLFRRALFDGVSFREGILYEDLELTPVFAAKTEKIGFVDEPLYNYYQRGGSIMRSDFSPRQLDIFTVLESVSMRMATLRRFSDFSREIEYLYIEHLLRSAALRFCTAPERKALFARLRETMKKRFPRWRKNPYLKKKSFPFRLIVRLAGGGHYRLIALLRRLKGRL
ncbi:MAG: glycosyltransferase [Clostridia bacterium]|nr:glycosyltransferase [Clostridia bacterium]